MLQQISISSSVSFVFSEYLSILGMDDLELVISPDEIPDAWGFCRKGRSKTMFAIERVGGEYVLSMDCLASYDDYRLFPYLADCLSCYLAGCPYERDGKGAFAIFDEEWIEESIGEEIAYVKCMLALGVKYYIELPVSESFPYLNTEVLRRFGVSCHSSTPRIYGYTQYLMSHDLLPCDLEREEQDIDEDLYVDVPQHESIGTVRSWQTDGAETTESYSADDVAILLELAEEYKRGGEIEGVVLNDIGTIFENGIGVERDVDEAVFWYRQAIRHGDTLYAPTSLGDIYRRGYDNHAPDLPLALEAYRVSTDPYAWYRIGQSYEEGWIDAPNIGKAMFYYRRAADVGHHLALRRLECEDDE